MQKYLLNIWFQLEYAASKTQSVLWAIREYNKNLRKLLGRREEFILLDQYYQISNMNSIVKEETN